MTAKFRVHEALLQWCRAASNGDIKSLGQLYWPEATLHPTFDDKLQNTAEGRHKYFEFFLRNGGFKDIVLYDERVDVEDCCAFVAGFYDFHNFTGEVLKARFSFSYALRDGKWKIICHHSSLLPASNL